jgi:hypothetical protein
MWWCSWDRNVVVWWSLDGVVVAGQVLFIFENISN